MKLKYIILLNLMLAFYSLKGQSSVTLRDRIEVSPISNYVMGKNFRINYGFQRKHHTWYVGLGSHLNIEGKRYSLEGAATRANGYAERLSERLHLNLGYEKQYPVNEHFTPFFFVDVIGGKISLLPSYAFYGYDEYERKYWYTLLMDDDTDIASFIQLTLGIGCDIRIGNRWRFTNRMGVGESFTIHRLASSSFRDRTFDHLVGHYSVGLKYQIWRK